MLQGFFWKVRHLFRCGPLDDIYAFKRSSFSGPLKLVEKEKGSFLCFERRLVAMDKRSSLLILLRGTQTPCLLTFWSGSKLWIKMHWGQVLILNYFCVDCSQLILLKDLDWGLISVPIWVHLSVKYCKKESWKTSFGFTFSFIGPTKTIYIHIYIYITQKQPFLRKLLHPNFTDYPKITTSQRITEYGSSLSRMPPETLISHTQRKWISS